MFHRAEYFKEYWILSATVEPEAFLSYNWIFKCRYSQPQKWLAERRWSLTATFVAMTRMWSDDSQRLELHRVAASLTDRRVSESNGVNVTLTTEEIKCTMLQFKKTKRCYKCAHLVCEQPEG